MWSSPRVVIICTRFVVLIVGTVSRTSRDIEEDTVVVLSLVLRVWSGLVVGQAHISLGCLYESTQANKANMGHVTDKRQLRARGNWLHL